MTHAKHKGILSRGGRMAAGGMAPPAPPRGRAAKKAERKKKGKRKMGALGAFTGY